MKGKVALREPASPGEAIPRDILRDSAGMVVYFALSALIAAWAAARRAIGTRNGEQLT